MLAYGKEAAGRGLSVIIAGAGGAAHLPGMLAAVTPLPVIGVPVPLKTLDGMDSLLSIVQMPAGVPVATVAIDGARNAGLLAVRILAASDPDLQRADHGLPGRAEEVLPRRRVPPCAARAVPGASASSRRHAYVGLDVARCLALLGMMATHVLASRTADGDLATLHWLAGGRASALFAVLAGVSMALVSGGRTPVSGSARVRASVALAVRAALVGAIGLFLGALDTGIAVILTYYAVLFVLGLAFLGLRAPAAASCSPRAGRWWHRW